MKKLVRYRGIWTIEQKSKTEFVLRRRNEYVDTLPTMADAVSSIDYRVVCGN